MKLCPTSSKLSTLLAALLSMPTPSMQSLPTSLANDDDAVLPNLVVINADDAVAAGTQFTDSRSNVESQPSESPPTGRYSTGHRFSAGPPVFGRIRTGSTGSPGLAGSTGSTVLAGLTGSTVLAGSTAIEDKPSRHLIVKLSTLRLFPALTKP